MGAGAGVDLRTRSKQMSGVGWVVVTSATNWMTNSRCGAGRSAVTVRTGGTISGDSWTSFPTNK